MAVFETEKNVLKQFWWSSLLKFIWTELSMPERWHETVGQSNPTSQLSDMAHGFAVTRGGRTNTRCGVSGFFLLFFLARLFCRD